jgi:hypothetical protein
MSAAARTVKPMSDAEVRALFLARAQAELAAADSAAPGSDAVAWRGALMAQVAAVKGLAGPAEASGGSAMEGADGEALLKALEALGWERDEVFFTLSRPEPGLDGAVLTDRLRLQIEAVDPELVLALDADAAVDLAEAFGVEPLLPGVPMRVLGRRLLAVDGFEASLGNEKRKRAAWEQLKAGKPEGSVY